MYSSLPEDIRDRHPYHMYDEIKAQPEAVALSLQLAQESAAEVARVIGGARRVFLTGCGTSFHAAQGGAHLFQAFSRGQIDARAVEAYELVTYLPTLRPDDVVIALTHSGTTVMTLRALEQAHRSGVETLVVSGFPDREAGNLASRVIPTGYSAERSWAHTASYTAALTTLAALANSLAHPGERLDLDPLPEAMNDALQLEEIAHRLAANVLVVERYRDPARIVLAGAGPHEATAREGVLKLLETSYVPAGAFELEEMLHGPLAAVSEDTLLVIIAPPGRSTERAAALARAAHQLGTVPVVLAGSENADAFEDAHRVLLPDVPEVLSAVTAVVPLQFLSYFLAVGKGINPDLLHRDDGRYLAARSQYA